MRVASPPSPVYRAAGPEAPVILLLPLALAEPPPPPIINGAPATADEFPMAGAMILAAHIDMGSQGELDYKGLLCSSTLIAPDVVLLAAHCLDPDTLTYGQGDVSQQDIRWTREADLTRWDGSRTPSDWPDDAVPAWDWVFHEDFSLWQMQVGIADNSDIGLIFLEDALVDVPLAVLVTEDEDPEVVEGAAVSIVGWGQQEATDGWEAPPSGTYALKMWGESVIGEVGPAEFQVGPGRSDVRKCHGDSGGPTFMDVAGGGDAPMRQIGVTSHAYDSTDCERKGGVDTRVGSYLEWIDDQMRSRCADGTRAWCEEEGILPAGFDTTPDPDGDPDDADDADDEEIAGCGCAAEPGGAAGVAALMAALLATVGRRRR